MTERERKIVETAFRLFAHYGVKKTTIIDIAEEAKVSRQTLYNAFKSKEDLMCGAIEHYARNALEAIQSECEGTEDAMERLDVAFRHLVSDPYNLINQLPHADEIMQLVQQISGEQQLKFVKIYKESIWYAIAPAENAFRSAGIAPDDISEFIRTTFAQIKREARDEEHLHKLYTTLKQLLSQTLRAG